MASGTAVLPAGSNTYVKDHQATGGLIVDFARNPADFTVNQWTQIRSVTKDSGYYARMTVAQRGRIMNSDARDYVWEDGADRPMRNNGTEYFNFYDYRTKRRDYDFLLGNKSVEQAAWDIQGQHAGISAQLAMTVRSQLAATAATTAANYDASHRSAVASITDNTSHWGVSTVERQDIRRSLNYAAKQIHKDTLGAVKPSKLMLVISAEDAPELAEVHEIVMYLRENKDSLDVLYGRKPGNSNMQLYSLPAVLYGYPLIIEDAVKETAHKGATASKEYVWPSGSAAMIARLGELEAPSGGPNFSTITAFAYEEMTVETFNEGKHRRVEGHVVDDITYEMTAPVSGFLFTSAFG